MGIREQVDADFGQRVRAERERRGWTQDELAQRLSDRGLTAWPSTIAKLEAAQPRAVRLAELVALADQFEMSIDALVGRVAPVDARTFVLQRMAEVADAVATTLVECAEEARDAAKYVRGLDEAEAAKLAKEAEKLVAQLDAATAAARRLSDQTERVLGA